MKKSIPIGVSNYVKLREEDYYSVDKTLMIKEYLERKSEVTLITRPRRFGKTSNMSMMSEFFDIKKDSKKLFQTTNITETKYKKEMNRYPVIFLSFANCKGDYESMKKLLFETIRNEYARHQSLFDKDDSNKNIVVQVKKNFRALCVEADLVTINTSIKVLSQFLYEHYQKRVMIFIDEYDTPFMEAHVHGYYQKIKEILSSLLHSALKDNNYLQYAMLTGIQRVAKENIFSDLNNLEVFSVKDKGYAQYFGFTSEEVKTLLEYYGLALEEEVKAMYDGYNMGGVDIYNPWSIINYAKRQELVPYWVNTSSNTMMKEAMKHSDISFQKDYEKLIQDGYLDVQTNLSTSFYEVQDNSNLWGLFVNAGYLTIDHELRFSRMHLRIPNQEVRGEFASLTANYLGVDHGSLNAMFAALEEKRLEHFLCEYRIILLTLPSYHDLKDENSYHLMMLGMCANLQNDYEIVSNREVGKGRCDTIPLRYIILKAKTKQMPSYVIELKYTKVETDLTQLAIQAIEQIKSRQYDYNLEDEVIYVGLAHYGKEVEMRWCTKEGFQESSI